MKKRLVKYVFAALCGSLLMVGSALALPLLNGGISLTGGKFTPINSDGSATTINVATGVAFTWMVVADTSDDFMILETLSGTMTDFQFNPLPAGGIIPLWSVTNGATTFAFNLESVTVKTQDNTDLVLSGKGIFTATGYEPTPGTWDFTGQTGNTTSSWSSSSGAESAPIPEPATMLLFGAGLTGLFSVARRKKDKK